MDSETGLIIQLSGISLIAVLFVSLTNALKSDALKYWRSAWIALTCSLFCLSVALNFQSVDKWFFALYFLSDYVFGFMVIAGCRNYAMGEKISVRSWLWLLPGILAAMFFAFSVGSFNHVFNFHSLIMAAGFAVAFFSLKQPRKFTQDNFGWRVIRIALALLTLDFLHYIIIFSLQYTSYPQIAGKYLVFNSIIDLVMEILLGFGMVIALFERVRLDIEEANRKLKEAHDKLEQLAHIDPLTTAFTRHAFYSFLQKQNRENKVISGCVGVFDIDNLKPINDRFGHAAGDAAISTVARAIRSLIRADDLIFRWGGDEFFVVMLGFESRQAANRMNELNKLLTNVELFGVPETLSIGVSCGFADFSEVTGLETTIERADAEMYREKQKKKSADKTLPVLHVQTMPSETSAMLQ